MSAAQERLRKFLDNKISSHSIANSKILKDDKANTHLSNDKILSLMGMHRLLDCSNDTSDSDALLEPIECAFDDTSRELAHIYTRIRLEQFSSKYETFGERIEFNFKDLSSDFVNKLSAS